MATLIRPNSPTEEVTPVNGKEFTLEEVQRLVGGDVQLLEVAPGIYGEIKVTARDKMFVIREGKLNGLPFNRVATAITSIQRAIAFRFCSDHPQGRVLIETGKLVLARLILNFL